MPRFEKAGAFLHGWRRKLQIIWRAVLFMISVIFDKIDL